MRVDALLDAGLACVSFDDFADPTRGEAVTQSTLEKIVGTSLPLGGHKLSQFSSEAPGNGNVAVLLALSLLDSDHLDSGRSYLRFLLDEVGTESGPLS